MLREDKPTMILAIDPRLVSEISIMSKVFNRDTNIACLKFINSNAINSGIKVKSNFRNGGRNGTAKLKKKIEVVQ